MKTDLTKYNSFINTDKLTDDIAELLTQFNHRNSEYGITTMLNEFFKNKEGLINLFRKSSSYAGNLRIVFEDEFARESARDEVREFVEGFLGKLNAKELVMRKTDEEGKTLEDHIRSGPKFYYAHELLDEEKYEKMQNDMAFLKKYTSDGHLVEDQEKYDKLGNAVGVFSRIPYGTLTAGDAENINEYLEKTKKNMVAEGMKTSRAMNRVCKYYGVNKAKEYNKLFAEYADLVSEKTRKLKVVLSVNPYDFLTMSFGVNWASCHTIDKNNKRNIGGSNGYHGAYCGGTLSYMLDGTSFIMYIVKPEDDVQTDGKIYRNMFHWNGHNLLQGRIYPQGNDGATDLYTRFRGIVQEKFSEMLGLTSKKWIRNGNVGNLEIDSEGVHYRDYICFSYCSYSYPSEYGLDTEKDFVIGHSGICPHCGRAIEEEKYLSHSGCTVLDAKSDEETDDSFWA